MPIAPDNLDLQVPIGADSSRYKVSDRRLSVSIGTYRELSAPKTDFQACGPVVRGPVVRGPAVLFGIVNAVFATDGHAAASRSPIG